MEDYKNKIKKISALTKILYGERQKGKVIVFTNGCFDLIHIGHIRYLSQAKKQGDILVVALNSDKSMRDLKGKKRPLMSHKDRQEIVASLEFVDYVVIFDELTPFKIITQLKPQVLVKGGDYRRDEIVGRDFVESEGGKVVIIPPIRGRSTTDLIKRIVTRYGKEYCKKN